jgi:hypothetical protein
MQVSCYSEPSDLLRQVESRNDHACVAPALLPVLASPRRTHRHRQECLCHTILCSTQALVIPSGARNLLSRRSKKTADSSLTLEMTNKTAIGLRWKSEERRPALKAASWIPGARGRFPTLAIC